MRKEYKVLELTLSGVDVYLGTYSSSGDAYDSGDREYVKSEPLEDILNELAKEDWEVESISNLAVILSRPVDYVKQDMFEYDIDVIGNYKAEKAYAH